MLSKRHLLGVGVAVVLGATTGFSILGRPSAIVGGLVGSAGGVKLAVDIERAESRCAPRAGSSTRRAVA